MKKILLLSVLTLNLTACISSPPRIAEPARQWKQAGISEYETQKDLMACEQETRNKQATTQGIDNYGQYNTASCMLSLNYNDGFYDNRNDPLWVAAHKDIK